MMAHEIPVSLQAQEGTRTLPNGEKVDFGNGNKNNVNHKRKPSNNTKKKDKYSEPSLPDGAKPVFGNEKKSNTYYDSDSSNSSGKEKKKNVNAKKTNKDKDVFAGSTFHSSPEALNLPKPSFKIASPKPEMKNPVTNYPSPYYNPGPQQIPPPQGTVNPGMPQMPMNFAGMGPGPVAGMDPRMNYPGQMVPGAPGYYPYFNPQHGQHSQPPVQQHPPQYQLPLQSQQAKLPPSHPVQPFPADSTSGQKISFNDLFK